MEVSNINPKKQSITKGLGVILAIIICAVLTFILFQSDKETQKRVTVVRLKNSLNISQPISSKNIDSYFEAYDMYEKEFESYGIYVDPQTKEKKRAIVLWSEKDKLIGNYASTYLKSKRILFWDDIVSNKENRNPYLTKIQNKEFLLLDGIDASEYGEIPVPGDKINIRITYKDKNYDLPPEELVLMSQNGVEPPEITITEFLFQEATVVDMLNSGKESIFDKFYELLALPEADKQAKLNDENFRKTLVPKWYLLALTPEEVDKYAKVKTFSPIYTTTILSRSADSVVLEYLADIIKQVKTTDTKSEK